MTKQEIIEIINNAVPRIDKNIFGETGKNMIGSNQFRELAALCRHAECFEEIEMLIRYNESKAISENKGQIERNSWAALMKSEKESFADIVVECMNSIKEASGDDETQCLKNLSLFFGYFYWNARIWAVENKLRNSQTTANNSRNASNTGYNRSINSHFDRQRNYNNNDRHGR